MTLGSVVAQETPTLQEPESLGPLSPELVLVDPDLAERARGLLPERSERTEPRPRRLPEPAVAAPPRAPRAPRRLRRTVVLAALILTAGAASGQFIAGRNSGSPASLEPRPVPPRTDTKPTSKRERRSAAPAKTGRPRATPSRGWAANVLGVTADVSRKGVSLVWKRPTRSDHVVVVRKRDPGKQSVVVFRGRAAAYRDSAARSCTEYRYTIVNYDRRGRRSTGVLTSVVTPGCA